MIFYLLKGDFYESPIQDVYKSQITLIWFKGKG